MSNLKFLYLKRGYHHLSGDVEIVKVKLKDIKFPCGNRKTCSIDKTLPYLWLKDKKLQYGGSYKQGSVLFIESDADAHKRMLNLLASLKKGYDPQKNVVTLRKNNILIDGAHRCAALYYLHGGDFEVLSVRER